MKGLIRKINENAAVKRYRQDFTFRTLVNTVCSSVLTGTIGVYHLLTAVFTAGTVGQTWLGSLAAYYCTLSLTRIYVLLSHRKGKKCRDAALRERRDVRNYLSCGALLVLLSFFFSGVLVLTVVEGYHQEYAGHLIFAAALYAFCKIGFAIKNVIKAEKRNDLTVTALRSINAADALVSIVSLQAAMLAAYPATDVNPFLFNAATGGVAALLILALGTFMTVRGSALLRRRAPRTDESSPDETSK